METSLSLLEASFGLVHSEIADILENLGAVSSRQKEFQKSVQYFSRELELRKQLEGESHPNVIRVLKYLGKVYDDWFNAEGGEERKSLALQFTEEAEKRTVV